MYFNKQTWLKAAIVSIALLSFSATSSAGRVVKSYPSSAQYAKAMQNPGHYLRDPKLAGAKPETNAATGRLMRFAGSFSTVFKFRTGSGRKIAVRFFHPNYMDSGQQKAMVERRDIEAFTQRYAMIGKYLGDLRKQGRLPPEFIEFAVVKDGIKMVSEEEQKAANQEGRAPQAQLYPVMKMPWVEGRSLGSWIGRRLGQANPKAVEVMAERFRFAVKDMRGIGVAHGDLHHGNVMVESDGTMRFIDYDGMFVPGMEGLQNSELGHPNYQHPMVQQMRVARPFDGNMDNFSAILIYMSLRAVAVDSGLWDRYHREDNLVLTGQDLQNPTNSPAFQAIKSSRDPIVASLARQLEGFTKVDPRTVPDLETALKVAVKAPSPSGGTAWYKRN